MSPQWLVVRSCSWQAGGCHGLIRPRNGRFNGGCLPSYPWLHRHEPSHRRSAPRLCENGEHNPRTREQAIVASILVDDSGVPVDKGCGISSFAWGLPLALNGDFHMLPRWSSVEPELIHNLNKVLERRNGDGAVCALSIPVIHSAHEWLVNRCKLPMNLVKRPRS